MGGSTKCKDSTQVNRQSSLWKPRPWVWPFTNQAYLILQGFATNVLYCTLPISIQSDSVKRRTVLCPVWRDDFTKSPTAQLLPTHIKTHWTCWFFFLSIHQIPGTFKVPNCLQLHHNYKFILENTVCFNFQWVCGSMVGHLTAYEQLIIAKSKHSIYTFL